MYKYHEDLESPLIIFLPQKPSIFSELCSRHPFAYTKVLEKACTWPRWENGFTIRLMLIVTFVAKAPLFFFVRYHWWESFNKWQILPKLCKQRRRWWGCCAEKVWPMWGKKMIKIDSIKMSEFVNLSRHLWHSAVIRALECCSFF